MRCYCEKCKKTMVDTAFFTYKDGTKCEMCKKCLTMHIDNYEPDTFLWILEKLDVPYAEAEWRVKREKEFEKNYTKATTSGAKDARNAAYAMTKNSGVVLGRYLSQMKLKKWKDLTWADTEKIKQDAEEQANESKNKEEFEKEIESVRKAYEQGEISEAQWKTYIDLNPEEEQQKSLEASFLNGDSGAGGAYTDAYPTTANNPYEIVPIDVGADLTDEDKLYLAMKWGQLYQPYEWVSLEKLFNEFMESFDIQGAARLDTLKLICKTSLKMNQAVDAGDIDSYQKLSRVYDAMMKSAKFTEAQNKDGENGSFSSVGELVAFCEKEEGAIPKFNIDAPQDVVDTIITDLKQYNKTLISEDTALAQQIEAFLKAKQTMEEMKKDKEEARAKGLDYVEVDDEDMEERRLQLLEEQAEDDEIYKGEEGNEVKRVFSEDDLDENLKEDDAEWI